MTVGLAYVRNSIDPPELVIASDSRLSGGEDWDFCRKVFPLVRGDSAIVFTGLTERFFPLISQITAYCDSHKKIYSRAMKLPELFYKIAYLCESLLRQVTNLPIGIKHPMGDFTLLLCGWDWSDVSGSDPIFAGRIQYNERTGNFKAARAYFPRPPQVINHRVIAIGDCLPDFYREYNKLSCQQDVLDFEPLRILQKIAESSDIRTIGGSVQAVKIYKHYNSLPLLIDRSEVGRFLYGRKLFDWEEVAMESTTLKLDL